MFFLETASFCKTCQNLQRNIQELLLFLIEETWSALETFYMQNINLFVPTAPVLYHLKTSENGKVFEFYIILNGKTLLKWEYGFHPKQSDSAANKKIDLSAFSFLAIVVYVLW